MVVQIQEIRAIHANLKEQFPNICLAEPLSYINMLVGSVHECFVPHQPVLLLCKKVDFYWNRHRIEYNIENVFISFLDSSYFNQ